MDNEQPKEAEPVNQSEPETFQSDAMAQSPENEVITSGTPAQPALNTESKKPFYKKIKLGIAGIIFIVLLVLAIGSAGAYFGLILPNKPENLLKTAITKTAEQKKSKFTGTLTYESTDKSARVKAMNFEFDGQADVEKGALQAAVNMNAGGFKVPFEVRNVDRSAFFKFDDLNGLKSAVQLSAPQHAGIADALDKKLTDQWIEIDPTLQKQAGAGCSFDSSYSLTKADTDMLFQRYKVMPFGNIKSTTNDMVNGISTTRYEIDIDDNKAAEYANGLNELSLIQKMRECNGNNNSINSMRFNDGDTRPLTLWVYKGTKTIAKVATRSTAQDEQKNKFKSTLEMTFQYGQADISKPENAQPLTNVLGGLSGDFQSLRR